MATATLNPFVPNGLLHSEGTTTIGSSALAEDISGDYTMVDARQSADTQDMEMDEWNAQRMSTPGVAPRASLFAPNGLLDASPTMDAMSAGAPRNAVEFNEAPVGEQDETSSSALHTQESFDTQPASLGALENTLASQRYIMETPSRLMQGDATLIDERTSSSSFRSNGLLDALGAKSAGGSSFQEDEDDLPSLSAIFGDPSPLSFGRSRPGGATGVTFSSRTVKFPRRNKRAPKPSAGQSKHDHMHLLERPIHRLMDDLALDAVKPQEIAHERNGPVEAHMWVDRYRPKRFLDLIGDDRVHRETMGWLKEWDACVFGRKKNRKRAQENERGPEGYEDPYGRPYEKVLLLSGPPGLGKTTLAHVIASSAGYSVLEINASDERAARIVDDRIRPALEAGSSVGDTKPVCVVIDEIDGVGGAGGDSNAFINSLLQLTLDKPKRRGGGGGRRNNKDSRPLLRPIICICNDLYAPSLRALRTQARLLRLKPTNPLALATRLRDVCELEGMKADNRALSALVGVTKGDIRSCLNTLQFIHSRAEEVTEAIVRSSTVGLKDSETSSQSVWNDIFLPLSKKRVKQLGLTDGEESRYVGRLHFEVEATDEVERVMQGCFSHYPRTRLRDSPWATFEKAHEWLEAFDVFTGTYRGDDTIWALREYRAYCVVAFQPLFNSMGNPKAEWPSADYDSFVTSKANEEIYSTFAKQLPATANKSFTQDHFPIEFLPFLNRIISPPLRTVNNQVIKADERDMLTRLVSIMADLKLRFVQEKTEDGQLVYRLDPPIDVFITYDGKRSGDVGASRYAVRHVVAQQVDAELAKRTVEVIEHGRKGQSGSFFGIKGRPGPIQGEVSASAQFASSRDVPIDPSDKPPTDFFGRPLVVSTKPGLDKAPASVFGNNARAAIQKFRIAYKFHEGNSAAVRRPVKISSLL